MVEGGRGGGGFPTFLGRINEYLVRIVGAYCTRGAYISYVRVLDECNGPERSALYLV